MNRIPIASRIIDEGGTTKTITVFSNDVDGTITTEIDIFDRASEAKATEQHGVFGAEGVGKRLIGWQDYADSSTSEGSPIVQSNVNGGEVQIINNNSDTATDCNTNVNGNTTVEGVNDLWDTSTNTFIFKDTGIGKNDLFDIRFNPNVSPSIVSQDFGVRMDFYDDVAGTGNKVFSLKKSGKTRNDSAGVFDDDFIHIKGYFGESILNGSAIAYFYGSKSFELEYIGHMINIFKISR